MTSELLPRPPRRVRETLGGRLWFARIFTLPFALTGISLIGNLILMVLLQIAGSDIPGTVTGARISSGRHSSYIFEYQFEAGGQKKQGSDNVSRDLYDHYKPGIEAQPGVTVRYFAIGPLEHSALRTGGSTWGWIGLLLLVTTFWNSLTSAFIYRCWIKPMRVHQLYKNGEATIGVLQSKRFGGGGRGSTRYYVSYSFTDPHSGREFQNEIEVWRKANWELAQEGRPVIVLFSGDNPKQSTVYEFGGYRVVGKEA